ncbi:outer envelope membrane protein 7 [Euphorbia peplus]|nr:outer envelope membrane protein 7 [Euphorbia peplus]
MAAITTALIAVAGVILGWIAIEMACKPCLEKGREAIDRSLNPDYDPDEDDIRNPLNSAIQNPPPDAAHSSASSAPVKAV